MPVVFRKLNLKQHGAVFDDFSTALARAADGDAILWLACPKGSSKNCQCGFNRNSGFAVIGAAGFESVRQVGIDKDWSALRFRRVGYIQSFARAPERASSAAGNARAQR